MLNEVMRTSGEVDSVLDLSQLVLTNGERKQIYGRSAVIATIQSGFKTIVVRDYHHHTLDIMDFFDSSIYLAKEEKERYWLKHYGEEGAAFKLFRSGDLTILDLTERRHKRTEKCTQMVIDPNIVAGLIALLPSHV